MTPHQESHTLLVVYRLPQCKPALRWQPHHPQVLTALLSLRDSHLLLVLLLLLVVITSRQTIHGTIILAVATTIIWTAATFRRRRRKRKDRHHHHRHPLHHLNLQKSLENLV
jgi:heme/copper-type cytochrome/quinol oxidase subunit 2